MGVYDRLDPIIKGKPAKIFLMIGINDIAHHLSTDSIVKNITKIIRKIKKETPSTQLYIQSLLPTNDSFERFKTIMGKTPQIIEIIRRACPDREIYIHRSVSTSDDSGNDRTRSSIYE